VIRLATNTPNLNLLKKDPVTDGNETFNVQTMLNDNWDKIDYNVGVIRQQFEQIEIDIPVATLEQPGITQLSSATNSDAEDRAATPKAVKAAVDDTRASITKLSRDVANLNMQLEASKRVIDGATFGSNFADSFGMEIDTTKLTSPTALTVGQTEITVNSAGTLAAGMEVTVYDDVNMERTTVTAFEDRTEIIENVVNGATVVSGAFYTDSNNGRKAVRLSNGWIVCAVKSSGELRLYVSKDKGKTFSLLGNRAANLIDIAITSKGTVIYMVLCVGSTMVAWHKFDALDGNGGDYAALPSYATAWLDTGLTSLGNADIAINEAGTELHAAWSCRTSTYTQSYNIRYAKGTINVDGSVTWGSASQVTTFSTDNYNAGNPSIVVANGNPIILHDQDTPSAGGTIFARWLNGSTWNGKVVFSVGGTLQADHTSAIYVPKSVNGLDNGRIWVVWDGTDSTYNFVSNIRVSYSDDLGATWSSMQCLTNSTSYTQHSPSITADKNNNIYVMYNGIDSGSYHDVRMLKNIGGAWDTMPKVIATGANGALRPSTLYDVSLDIGEGIPLTICRINETAERISFYANWKTVVPDKVLTVPPLTKSYKAGAVIARTTAVVDAVNKALKFGAWTYMSQTTINVNNVTVDTGAGSTMGNAGRKLIKLDDGTLVSVRYYLNNCKLFKSTDNGYTWSKLAEYNHGSSDNVSDIALETDGINIFCVSSSQSAVVFRVYDKSGSFTNNVTLYSGASNFLGLSMLYSRSDKKIYVVWSCKMTSLPNSNNIMQITGTIGSGGTVTWTTAINRSSSNVSGMDFCYPSVVVNSDNQPVIVCSYWSASNNYILAFVGDSNITKTLFSSTSYRQDMPNALFVPSSINGLQKGRIYCAWNGTDATETAAQNVRYSYSDDGGNTWNYGKVTTGNTVGSLFPTLTADKGGNVFMLYCNSGTAGGRMKVIMRKLVSGAWSAGETVAEITNANAYYPSALLDFSITISTMPLFVFTELNTSIRFSGGAVIDTSVPAPLQESDIRFKLKDTDEVVLWVQRDEGVNLAASINGETMDKTSTAGEDQFTIALDESGPAECKLVMTRDNTASDVKVTRILGGVS
jgi:hypothetical protein